MTSARNYYTDFQLIEDVKYWRKKEIEYKLRARSEWEPSKEILHKINTAKLRAKASENILRARELADDFSPHKIPT